MVGDVPPRTSFVPPVIVTFPEEFSRLFAPWIPLRVTVNVPVALLPAAKKRLSFVVVLTTVGALFPPATVAALSDGQQPS